MVNYNETIEDTVMLTDNVNIAVNDGQKYAGKFVAIASVGIKDVIASGNDFAEVHDSAKLKTDDPIVFFVPDQNIAQVY